MWRGRTEYRSWGAVRRNWFFFGMRRDTIDRWSCVWRQEIDPNLALLNGSFGSLFDGLPDTGDIIGIVGSREDGLNEEFVTAFGIEWRVFFHRLEKHCRL